MFSRMTSRRKLPERRNVPRPESRRASRPRRRSSRKSGMSSGLRIRPPLAAGWRSSGARPRGQSPAARESAGRPCRRALRAVAAHPALPAAFRWLGFVGISGDRDLVRAPEPFEVMAVHLAGPVQPFGLRRMIIGQRGRTPCPVRRASSWILRISRTQCSSVAAIAWCMLGGSLPSTKYGV